MLTSYREDLWSYLKKTTKPIVLYGMGNGADKILKVAARRNITVSDFFASDGFVRGHAFHGKTVLSYAEVCRKYGKGNFIVLLSFATALCDVLSHIREIAEETELYAPDLPVREEPTIDGGFLLFDYPYFEAHQKELEAADALFRDEESHRIFKSVIDFRLSGRISHLLENESDKAKTYRSLLHAETFRRCADLGAYTGDTVRELLPYAPGLTDAYCMEPDPRNFRKLSAYASSETRCQVHPLPYAAGATSGICVFLGSGNRNAAIGSENKKGVPVSCMPLPDALALFGSSEDSPKACIPKIDYIKLDVEGSEKDALIGALPLIERDRPALLVSLYHRVGDLFSLPLFLADRLAGSSYRFSLRRFRYLPAWDLNLYLTPEPD